VFSIAFSNSTLDNTYVIHRAVNHLRENRAPTVTTTQ
jgi:hypothetical protein